MPANLNALIRYKTINSCLHGGRKWTIKELTDACSDALAESRGRYEEISERTIRDDIRVMRSDILGFSAPLKQHDGLYFYSDPHYSILSISITDSGLINQIIKLLLELRSETRHPELEMVLEKLISMTNNGLLLSKKEKFNSMILDKSELSPVPDSEDLDFQFSGLFQTIEHEDVIDFSEKVTGDRIFDPGVPDKVIWEDVYKLLAPPRGLLSVF